MRHITLFSSLVVLALLTGPAAAAQTTHRISLTHTAGTREYLVKPDRITARAGDILVFHAASGDHSIIFENAMPAAARTALGAAMPRRVGELAGPLFGADAEYRIVVPALPAGEYRFYCLPHRAYDEVGVLIVR